MLWHLRLGHSSHSYLKKLQRTIKSLDNVKFDDSILECEVCIMAKMEKLPFKETKKRAERPLQVIHTDTIGPIKPDSYPGFKTFIVVFVDDYSRFAKAYSVRSKNETGDVFGKYVVTELSPPYTPEHNGVAERFDKTIQVTVRTYMFDSGLPKSMWELAVDAAVHAYNRMPHKTIDFKIPLEKFAPNARCHFNQIKRFGCIGYVKVKIPNSNFDQRAIKSVIVGYKKTGYVLWHPSTRKFIESRHVRFNEKAVYKDIYRSDQLDQSIQEAREENNCD